MPTFETDPRDFSKQIPDAEWMVCAVCGLVLEKLDKFDHGYARLVSWTWRHPFDVRQAGEDHEPVPVMRKDAPAVNERCDFCLEPEPMWLLPVENFQEPFGLPDQIQISDSDWAACDVCADLIRRGYWDRLTQRALKSMKDRYPGKQLPEQTIYMVKQLYRHISQNVKGPIRPRGDRRSWTTHVEKEERDERS